ncbi:MAG: cytochrome c3 family protein [Pirellulales bacterium]|nr:cytochrome c3 family protein [Pirellulales bacterium]
MGRFRFPPWLDRTRPLAGALLAIVPIYLIGLIYFAGSPVTTDVLYSPVQPVAYSHAQHAGELGIDCRYCHNTVENAAFAAIPPTATCMNCHKLIGAKSDKLLKVRESDATGDPIHWIKVHDLPDYVYFNHSAHVTRGVSCVECHGRVDRMEQITQVERLSMGWCIECHRDPAPHLRPQEYITKLDWVPNEDRRRLGEEIRKKNNINPSTDCSTCHR